MYRHLGRSIRGYETHNGNAPPRLKLYNSFTENTSRHYSCNLALAIDGDGVLLWGYKHWGWTL